MNDDLNWKTDGLPEGTDKPESTRAPRPLSDAVLREALTAADPLHTVGSGVEHDTGKPDWSLLPLDATEKVVEVLTHGAEKYSRDNWKEVPNAENRYYSAMMRHVVSFRRGEYLDPESGLPHLAHAICCLLFLLERK